MVASRADLCDFQSFARIGGAVGVAHAYRNRRIRPSVVAELAVLVVSPSVYVSVAAQCQGMVGSGADLHIGEILWQVRIRVAVRRLHSDRRSLAGSRPVAELAVAVVSPCVGVPVTADGQGKIIGSIAVAF